MAADAKLGFDDNAAFRHKDLFAKRDSSQEDPRLALHGACLECLSLHFVVLFRLKYHCRLCTIGIQLSNSGSISSLPAD